MRLFYVISLFCVKYSEICQQYVQFVCSKSQTLCPAPYNCHFIAINIIHIYINIFQTILYIKIIFLYNQVMQRIKV